MGDSRPSGPKNKHLKLTLLYHKLLSKDAEQRHYESLKTVQLQIQIEDLKSEKV